MKNSLLVASEGVRLAYRSTRNRFVSPKQYSGSIEQICRNIIRDCFDKKKKYFRVSPHNFRQFYARDFGMCCDSLLKLGYKKEVRQTIIYAMSKYVKHGKITTHITPFGNPVNFPSHTPESAAYMLHSIILLDNKKLLEKYKLFFSEVAKKIYAEDIDKKTGLLRKDVHFSSMKDHSLRESDCYNNCLLGMFAKELKEIKIKSPLSKYNYRKTIEKHFLRNDYFLEDLSKSKIFAGDANVFPFWTGLFDTNSAKDKKLFKKIIKRIRDKKLDSSWPLKYTSKEDAPKKMHIANILCPGYETDTLWMHLGLCYIKSMKTVDALLFQTYMDKYELLIKKHQTFYAVYSSSGKKFSRLLYNSDEAMIWCSIFLEMYLENNCSVLNKNLRKTIKTLHKLLRKNKIKWALIGSTNLQLQGMKSNPQDLDLVVQIKDLERLQKVFSAYSPSNLKELFPLSNLDTKKMELTLKINNIPLQIIGEIPEGLYVKKLLDNKLTKIKLENIEIPCFTLDAEAQAYSETNREDKAELIRDFLKQKL